MQVCYVGHQFSGDIANLSALSGWMRWLLKGAPHVAWIAPWAMDCAVLDDSCDRDAGLARDVEVVKRCDAMIMLGPRVSAGMAREMEHANRVYDLTGLLEEPNESGLVFWDGQGFAFLDPQDILGRIVDGRSVGIEYLRVERDYHGVRRPMWRPQLGCTDEEIVRYG